MHSPACTGAGPCAGVAGGPTTQGEAVAEPEEDGGEVEIMVPAASRALRFSFTAHVLLLAHQDHADTMRSAGYGAAPRRKRARVGTVP